MLFLSLALLLIAVAAGAPKACPSSSIANSSGQETRILLHTKSQIRMGNGIQEMVSVVDHLGGSREHFSIATISRARAREAQAAQQSAWISYRGTLGRMLTELEESRNSANGNLENTIDEFIAKQSGSSDACHSQLLEAKHQLNQLHAHVKDLSMQVNATDHELTALNSQVDSKLKENEALEKWREEQLEKLEEAQKGNVEYCDRLKEELNELQEVANSNVSMNLTSGQVFHNLSLVPLSEGKVLHRFSVASLSDARMMLPHIADRLKAALHQTFPVPVVQINVADNGELTQIRDRGHVEALQSAFKSTGECMKVETMTVGADDITFGENHNSLLEVADAPVLELKDDDSTQANATCTIKDPATIEVANNTETVRPPMDLTHGDFISVPCVSVNPMYFGIIWLSCNQTLRADASQCVQAANTENCTEQKKVLEKEFIKTYVKIARDIAACEDQTTNGYNAAKQAIEDQFRDRRDPIQNDASEISRQATEKARELEELRPRLQNALNAWHKLSERVHSLTEQCKQLPETTTDLNKVRDAIKALSLCPGLSKATLSVPQWAGAWVTLDDAISHTSDQDYDAKMVTRCTEAFKDRYPDQALRAASVGEITSAAVLDLPETNTASAPLMGACPQCEGNEDTLSASGHLRICWRQGVALTTHEKSSGCSSGPFSIACVLDGANINAA